MTKLPIALCLFTTTKPHFGHYTYLDTLNYLARQIPLDQFGARYAHIKVTPGQEVIAAEMVRELEARGFVVEQTVAAWSRGTSHQVGYLADMRKASQSPVIQSQPYMLLQEDDSPFTCHLGHLDTCLYGMTKALASNHNLVSTRFIRRCDWDGGVPVIRKAGDHFFSPNLDFQPMIVRSRDYLLANKVIEDHWSELGHLQCELVMRIAFDTLTRATERHMVWLPEYAETYHLGTPDYSALRQSLRLGGFGRRQASGFGYDQPGNLMRIGSCLFHKSKEI